MLKKLIKKILKEEIEDKFVECSECGEVILKENAQEMMINKIGYPSYHTTSYYYCKEHKKPYDEITDGRYYKFNVEVNEKGKVI